MTTTKNNFKAEEAHCFSLVVHLSASGVSFHFLSKSVHILESGPEYIHSLPRLSSGRNCTSTHMVTHLVTTQSGL